MVAAKDKTSNIDILLDFIDINHCLLCLLLLDGIKNTTELPTRLSKHDCDLTVMSKLSKKDVLPSEILIPYSREQ